ncbi:TRAP transporter small permease [Marinimicrococcus flavescens]|uniref:TRAP transporter small permease protein n=1 Tax=Marinimicrococcus flavescens TaxID=3031815 RepID=A0AAP3UXZ3_9PROT|nr:TRAP transporter small permease [Marinimicrococcus flavescens]
MLALLDRGLLSATRLLCILSLGAMTVAIIVNVFFRYVLASPLAWPPELARYLMVAITLLASSLALREGSHVAVTILVERLPLGLQLAVRLAGLVLVALFLTVVLWQGAILTFVEGPMQTAPSLGISMLLAFLPLPLGALLMLIELVREAGRSVERARNGISPFGAPAEGVLG